MGTSPEQLLTKLSLGVEVVAGTVRGLGAVAPGLEAAGLIETRKAGRVLHVTLTEAGAVRVAELAAAVPAAKVRVARAARAVGPDAAAAGKPKTAAARLVALEAMVAGLSERLAAVERQVGSSSGSGSDGGATVGVGVDETRAAVLETIGELDSRHRYGGLVPIPELRAELRRRGVAADDRAVDAALDTLEREWTIDLSVAQSPTQVADRTAGIERPGRGLLYYVARR